MLDADIKGFFDNLDKSMLVEFVEHRVADPRILRLIQKWLKAGVMEEGKWSEPKTGSPQGGRRIPARPPNSALPFSVICSLFARADGLSGRSGL